MKKNIIFQDRKISYTVTGAGPAVMLIHGFAENADVWKYQVAELAAQCKLIVPDLPGTANSEMIEDMSMEGMAAVLQEILKTEGDTAGSVIGHSMGGYITLALIEKYPEMCNKFGLFHSSAFADNEEKIATRKKGIEFIKEHGSAEFLKSLIPKLFAPAAADKHPELIAQQLGGANNFLPSSLVSYYEAMIKRPDRTNILRETAVPVLFILGKHDTAVPVEDGLKQCHLPQKSYIHLLQESGHMGMLEEAEKSTKILADFLLDR